MNTASQLSSSLRGVFKHPTHGTIGLVDDLLRLCQEQGLRLDWQTDCCRVRSIASGWEELIDKPVAKSVFRAILSRLAALCNDRSPNTVSPYGGQGEFLIGDAHPTNFRVKFVNTADKQELELIPVPHVE
jgi:hypothetical protein